MNYIQDHDCKLETDGTCDCTKDNHLKGYQDKREGSITDSQIASKDVDLTDMKKITKKEKVNKEELVSELYYILGELTAMSTDLEGLVRVNRMAKILKELKVLPF